MALQLVRFPDPPADDPDARASTEIRALMGRYGVSQAQLAELVGRDQTAVSARLRGTTHWRLPELQAIARFFGVTVGHLLGEQILTPRPPRGPRGQKNETRLGTEPIGSPTPLVAVAPSTSAA